MTQPDDTTQLGKGTDVTVDPADLETPADTPATSDGDQMADDDGELGGTGGENAGGAG